MEQENIERFALLVFSIHYILMLIGSIVQNWNILISIFFLASAVTNCFIIVRQLWDFHARTMFVAFSINLCLAVYSVNLDNVNQILISFLGVTVFLGLHGIQNVMVFSAGSLTAFSLYHLLISQTLTINGTEYFYKNAIQILNSYFIIFIIYFWNVKRNESSQMMGAIIRDLKIAEQGKDDFLANVSHEIRTPVNTVIGMSEVILREELDEKIKENVLNIQTSGRQLVSIVSDILDFSELQNGKMKLVEVEYNITSTIYDIISMAQAMRIDKDIEIIVDCDGTMPVNLIGDEQKLRRMICKFD